MVAINFSYDSEDSESEEKMFLSVYSAVKNVIETTGNGFEVRVDEKVVRLFILPNVTGIRSTREAQAQCLVMFQYLSQQIVEYSVSTRCWIMRATTDAIIAYHYDSKYLRIGFQVLDTILQKKAMQHLGQCKEIIEFILQTQYHLLPEPNPAGTFALSILHSYMDQCEETTIQSIINFEEIAEDEDEDEDGEPVRGGINYICLALQDIGDFEVLRKGFFMLNKFGAIEECKSEVFYYPNGWMAAECALERHPTMDLAKEFNRLRKEFWESNEECQRFLAEREKCRSNADRNVEMFGFKSPPN